MGTIAGLDDAVNKLTGGASGAPEAVWVHRDSTGATNPVAGRATSLWTHVGSPCGGALPGGTARNPTRTTDGALRQTNAAGGKEKRLTGFYATARQQASLVLLDRLADISGLVGDLNTEQNITGLAVTRYTGADSIGNEIWLEIGTLIGITATTIVAKYTNQAGTSNQVTPLQTIGGTNDREATRAIRLPLAAGDTGVRSVESITLTATTGTQGDICVVIARRIGLVNIPADGGGGITDYITGKPGPPVIKDDACLYFIAAYRASLLMWTTAALQFIDT